MPRAALLIDDDELIHAFVPRCFEGEGVTVHSARGGIEGITTAQSLRPDVILLDVQMPDMDGYEVCDVLSALPETSRIPVLFLTGKTDAADRVRGLSSGATDYLTKPFDVDELRARVRVCLRYKGLLELEAARASRDGLTGLYNRKHLDERLEGELASSARSGRPISCVLLDLDHFKSLNDTLGHAAGDVVLRSVAEVISSCCRKEDVACRYGGEEFCVLCPGINAAGAAVLAERIRATLAAYAIELINGQRRQLVNITASLGVADLTARGDGNEEQSLIARADVCLYESKRTGRNRVTVSAPAAHAA